MIQPHSGARRGHFGTALILFLGVLLSTPAAAKNLEVDSVPVLLYEGKPHRTRVGELEYLGGFELFSSERSFGGLSGLAVSRDGKSLYAVSDHGNWLTARLSHDAADQLTGVHSWHATPILTTRGTHARGPYRDAEALVLENDGTRLVSFEGRHRIRRYLGLNGGAAFQAPERVATPPELANAPVNGGLEAMTRLADGTLMILTEYYENSDGSFRGWLMQNGTAAPISYQATDGFMPTDLATLANGDILLLERKFSLSNMAVRIRRFRSRQVKPGVKLSGEKLATIRHPLTIDNFEGLAVRQDAQGNTLLYLVSDDNFLPFQRTLLLQFRLLR